MYETMTAGTRVSAVRCREKPKYGITARELLAKAREFYQNPENEREFQEWKAGKKGKK